MLILFSLWSAAAGATTSGAYPDQVFRAAGIERVEISGVRGRVTLRGETSPNYRLRVRHSTAKMGADWGLSVERRGSTLVLEVYNVAWGAEWRRVLKRDQWPAFDIELIGPPKPAMVGWRDGAITAHFWRATLDASLVTGPIEIKNGAGRATLQASRGDVRVTNFNGDLRVRGEAGQLALDHVNGQGLVNWFGGSIHLAALRGRLTLESERAQVVGRTLEGDFRFALTAGAVSLSDLGGRLRGRGQRTAWTVSPRPHARVAIRGGRGAVHVGRAVETVAKRALATVSTVGRPARLVN